MIDNKKVLAIIPARGGSKGLPGKNIRPLRGKPLIGWPIEAAMQSRYIDRVIVSTDDPQIAEIARSCGANVPFLRPKQFALDTSPSSEAVIHAIEFCTAEDGAYDYIVLLEPTSPLTETSDIDNALAQLHNSKGLAIVSVSKVESTHPVYCARVDENHFLQPYARESFAKPIRRQDVDPVYFFDGSLYISDVRKYLAAETFYHEHTLPYIVPAWKALEVDSLLDFIKIEAIMQHRDLLETQT